MPSTFEPSAHDKLAQAQYEEMLKARVLNQAKAVYDGRQFQDCKFDVVISYHDPDDAGDRDFFIASLIVYDAACDNTYNSAPELKILLRSEACTSFEGAYESLVDALLFKMTEALKFVDTQDTEDAAEVSSKF
ncbi:hypothetical protein GT037_004924 [Alternaria burnsii]|uniref:Uncharacterized protein n=1 Tax=Alternaria burnsii TaxID=1187904 RepID=A0A8H7BCB3_9PLEO|nr:uncharacterized protein GT037_004924 [Alternaria burnsii]KAF7676712.1 hypothetical protein GT037_004924 [Alternaria burnsii]